MPLFFMDDDGVAIPANRDARMYNVFAAMNDFIFKNALNEFEVSYSASSFVITLGTGEGILCGRHITNTTDATLSLSENDEGYIVLRADMSQAAGNRLSLMAVNSLYDEDINEDGGTYRDLVLGQYTTDANGVSSYTDLRKITSAVAVSSYVGKVEINNLQTESEMKAIFGEDTSWQLLASKLPIGENVFGNGKSMGLTDGNLWYSLGKAQYDNQNAAQFIPSGFGKNNGYTGSANNDGNSNARTFNLPTKQQLINKQYPFGNTGLVMETANVNIWLRIA